MSLPANSARSQRGLSSGARLGRYVVVRRIGGGGMAELYLARLDGPNRFVKPVALKLMHAHMLDTPEFVGMFMREARIAASLQHPQIVQVLDVAEADGEYFLALEYVHGLDLRRLLAGRRGEPLPLGAALRIVLDVATGLHHAHSLCDGAGRPLGIVHRDVSPSNILISYDGAVKLTDFGIARMTEQTHVTASGVIKGKTGYMSPEQCLQEHVDARSDVFALGVVLYEVTTGRPAFPGEMIAAMNRAIDGRFTPPEQIVRGYPPALSAIVRRALAARAEHRYPSVAVMRGALEAFARQQFRLDTSTDALARLLATRYGNPTLPDLDTPPPMLMAVPTAPADAATARLAPSSSIGVWPPRGRSRSHRVTVGVLGVLAGGLLGWQIARTNAASANEPLPPAAPAAIAALDADAIASIDPSTELAERSVAPLPSAETAIDESAATIVVVEEEEDDDREPRPRRRRPHRKAKKPAPEEPPSRTADAMLPRSAR